MKDVQGVFAAAITAFDEQDHFQADWQDRHFGWWEQQRIEGVQVAGTNHEGPSLSAAERRAVINPAINCGPLRFLIAGMGTPNLEATISASHYALEAGAAAFLLKQVIAQLDVL